MMEVPVGVEPTVTELQSVALATWLRNRFAERSYNIQKMNQRRKSFIEFF